MTGRKEVVLLCGAETRPGAKYETCHIAVLAKNGRCRKHGRNALKGPANPAWVDGRSGKYELPIQLHAAYQRFLDDPQWVNLADEIAMARSSLQALVLSQDEFETLADWRSEVRVQQEGLRRMVETEVRRVKAETMAVPVEMAIFFARQVTDVAIEAIRFVAAGGDERRAISRLTAGIALLTTGK